jgi:hypothetical protein
MKFQDNKTNANQISKEGIEIMVLSQNCLSPIDVTFVTNYTIGFFYCPCKATIHIMFKDKGANLVANSKAKKDKFSINMVLTFTTRSKVPKDVAIKDKEPFKTKFLPFYSNIVTT